MERHKQKAYSLRLSEELMEKIRKTAAENFRPISKQIELIIIEWYEVNENDKEND